MGRLRFRAHPVKNAVPARHPELNVRGLFELLMPGLCSKPVCPTDDVPEGGDEGGSRGRRAGGGGGGGVR